MRRAGRRAKEHAVAGSLIGCRTCDIGSVRFRITFATVLMLFTLVDMSAQAQQTYLGMDRNDYPGDADMTA